MSKSKGNVIDPLDVIDQYGADALRFTLAAMAAQGRDIKLSRPARRGLPQLRDQALERGALRRDERLRPRRRASTRAAAKETLNRWTLGECAKAIARGHGGDRGLPFNEAAQRGLPLRLERVLRLVPRARQARAAGRGRRRPRPRRARRSPSCFDEICKLLHPFMPFLTEELWAIKGEDGPAREAILALAPWPRARRPDRRRRRRPRSAGWSTSSPRSARPARRRTCRPARRSRSCSWRRSAEVQARARALGRHHEAPRAPLATSPSPTPPRRARCSSSSAARSAALPLEGVVDLEAERARLDKELQKLEAEIAKIDAKLGNADFLKRAPEEVVDEQRERREEAERACARSRRRWRG